MTRHPTLPVLALALALAFLPTPGAGAAEFDRLDGEALARVARSDGATPLTSLSARQLDALPAVLGDTRAAFFVVKTGQGNYTRVLATAGLRKAPDGGGPPVPVLVLERFDTFEPGRSGSRTARGAGVLLFDGFQIDLDSGQVVPQGQGGDLEYRKDGGGDGPALRTVGKAAIYTLKVPPAAAPAGAGPSPGRAVLPGDFAGRFRLQADGRWTGLLDLQVAADRSLSGRFRSEPHGTSYAVTGSVSAESPQKAVFTVKFPQTEQEYDGYLWTEGKNVMAGSFTMRDRTFGFFAVREGARAEAAEK